MVIQATARPQACCRCCSWHVISGRAHPPCRCQRKLPSSGNTSSGQGCRRKSRTLWRHCTPGCRPPAAQAHVIQTRPASARGTTSHHDHPPAQPCLVLLCTSVMHSASAHMAGHPLLPPSAQSISHCMPRSWCNPSPASSPSMANPWRYPTHPPRHMPSQGPREGTSRPALRGRPPCQHQGWRRPPPQPPRQGWGCT